MKEDKGKTPERPELVIIPDGFHGVVIGKGRKSLTRISAWTGAQLSVCDRKVYLSGSQEARKKAKMHIENIVVSK